MHLIIPCEYCYFFSVLYSTDGLILPLNSLFLVLEISDPSLIIQILLRVHLTTTVVLSVMLGSPMWFDLMIL